MKADVFVLYYYCQGKTLKTLAHWFQHVYRTVIVVYIVSKDVSRTAQRLPMVYSGLSLVHEILAAVVTVMVGFLADEEVEEQ